MPIRRSYALGFLLVAGSMLGGSLAWAAGPKVISGSGNIIPLLEEFRALAGDNLGNKPAQSKGRREINWDGIPDDKAAPAFLAADVFRGRGVILKTDGKGVQASARAGNPAGTLPRFGNINPSYVQTFNHFSAERLFSPVGSNTVDVTFVVSGTDKPATVRGFGAVYVDVDKEHTAFEFFGVDNQSLGKFAVPVNNGGFSFLGVSFDKHIVARVRIDYGTVGLGPDDGPNNDVAVMDDFIYDEPQAIAVPAATPKRSSQKRKY
jgi:hypothetical protein